MLQIASFSSRTYSPPTVGVALCAGLSSQLNLDFASPRPAQHEVEQKCQAMLNHQRGVAFHPMDES